MTISLSNTTVNEGTLGVQIGTLSGGSNYSIYTSNHSNYYVLNNNVLSLNSNSFLDSESSSFLINTLNDTNGRITSSSYSQLPTTTVTIGHGSGLWKQFTLTVTNKNETITVTPTNFQQNKYGATIAQVAPADSHFSGKDVYFTGPSFLEISGSNLKFTDDYYYSETGWVFNSSGTGWNLAAGDYSWDLAFTLREGFTTQTASADQGYTKLSTSSYLSSIFTNSNITTTAAVSLSAVPFVERDYGAIVATINYSGSENVTYSLKNHTFFEITASNKIKLKDDYFYNKADSRIEDQSGSFYALSAQGTTYNKLQITATNSANSKKLYTEEITIAEISATVFASSNVDGTPQITMSPVSFNDKQYGATIANINYSGSETPAYTLTSHSFLELTSSNKIKLKDTFYFDLNTGRVVKENFSGYILSGQGDSNKIQIHATDASSSKKLSSEVLKIGDITSTVFGTSNVTNRDESYTYVTDIKFEDTQLPKTGREEYQKNITHKWLLSPGEKISYSFLEPNAAYVGTYNEMKGIISPSTAFKTAARDAFTVISSFTDITFEEVAETGLVVGDFRIGITDADHFAMDSKFAAYSQGVGNSPKAGNVFFNGEKDSNNNNVPDYNEASTYTGKSAGFTTFLHEFLHSLGHKHPFDPIDASDSSEGNANIYQNEYEQYPYTIMSYTPLRDKETYNVKYEGINLKSGGQYYPTTPMLYDIIALQETYGAAKSSAPGDSNYTYTSSAPPFETIFDTGGTDTLNLSSIAGGCELDLSGSKISTIGNDFLIPFKTETGQPTTYGKAQGAPLGIVPGTEIEKVLLPDGASTVTSGSKSTFIVGKANAAITANVKSTQIGVKSSGTANDTINLKQATEKWTGEFQAINKGNNGTGATDAVISDMTSYLKHDLSLNLGQGTDTIQGTSGNDALFLQNFGSTGDALFFQDAGSTNGGARLLGIDTINLLEGNNFLDLTSTTVSLSGNTIQITAGTGNDILWLSDANENVSAGNGDDQITANGGTDTITTNLGADIITISKNAGNLTISDFDISTDKFIFKVAQGKVTKTSSNVLTVDNDGSLGDYVITFSNSPDLSNLSAFSTFA